MHISLATIILMNVLIPASNQAVGVSGNLYVSEVVRVVSPYSFECRIRHYKPAPVVRFRVSLPGIDIQKDDATATKLLEKQLRSAECIELRNAIFKSYFRIEADVWLDGNQYQADPGCEVIDVEEGIKKTAFYRPILGSSTTDRPAESLSRVDPARTDYSVTIKDLLDRKIDCSMLTEDTPLAEALELLCESVQPRLPLLVQWSDLQKNTFIQKETPIGVEGFGQLKLGQALSHVLQAAAGREPKPALITEGGILILGSQEMLLKHRNTRVYDVRDLLALPSTGGMYQQGNQNNLGNAVTHFGR